MPRFLARAMAAVALLLAFAPAAEAYLVGPADVGVMTGGNTFRVNVQASGPGLPASQTGTIVSWSVMTGGGGQARLWVMRPDGSGGFRPVAATPWRDTPNMTGSQVWSFTEPDGLAISAGDTLGVERTAGTVSWRDGAGGTVVSGSSGPEPGQSYTVTATRAGFILNLNAEITPLDTTHLEVTTSGVGGAAGSTGSVTVRALKANGTVDANFRRVVRLTSDDTQAVLPADYLFTAGDAGVKTFTGVSLRTAGDRAVTATDVGDALINGTSDDVLVTAGPFDRLGLTFPAATAGTGVSGSLVARDAYGNVVTSHAETFAITSSDPQATLPADVTMAGGLATVPVTLKTAGDQTVTATNTADAAQTATATVAVANAATLDSFAFSEQPASTTAGQQFGLRVTAHDPYGNRMLGFAGSVGLASSDAAATLPASVQLTAGTGTAQATLRRAGAITLTATDAGSEVEGTATVTVNPAATSKLAVTIPGATTAGTPFSVAVQAQDQFGNPTPGYAGTVGFSSSDGAATLPANTTLTDGAGAFSATLRTAGSNTVTATDTATPSIAGTSAATTTAVGPVAAFDVSAPASANAGSPVQFTVTARDASGNAATGYAGMVSFTSNDGDATLPADATLTAGVSTFSATLRTAGSRTITAGDVDDASVVGTSGAIAVGAASASTLVLDAPAAATAGTPFDVTVTAQDAFSNRVTGYAGSVTVTSTDGAAVLPAASALTNGEGTFSVDLRTAGSRTLTVGDGTRSATSGPIAVAPGAAADLAIAGLPAYALLGTPVDFTVMATDAYGNLATNYGGTLRFTSSAAGASLPADATLTDGRRSFVATLGALGQQTLTATDTARAALTVTSQPVFMFVPPAAEVPPASPPAETSEASGNTSPPARALACRRIPTLSGYTFAAAKRVLKRDSCTGVKVTRNGPLKRNGRKTRVLRQTPAAGTRLLRGDTVTLRLAARRR